MPTTRAAARTAAEWIGIARLSLVSFVPHNWPRRRSEVQETWSEWQDLNLRPPRPERGALPAPPISLADPQPFVVGRQLPIDGAGSPRSASVRPLVCFAVPFCWSGQTETST